MYVNSETDSPLVHSLSYGDIEASVFNTSINGSIQYGERCEQEFLKLGLRGISLIFSSGDDGVGSNMVQKDPKRACGQTWPTWPAGSPYVTTVGATMMTDKHLPACLEPYAFYTAPGYLKEIPPQTELRFRCNYNAETVCTSAFGGLITSGGGFSAIADRSKLAPWQDSVVSEYLASHNSDAYPPTSYFNKKGRGYPDVATYGSQFFVYLNGEIIRESGTSASAPVFAAMVTLWNDMRAAYNMPPMGFIAPFLYEAFAKAPEAFQDIRTGDNVRRILMDTLRKLKYVDFPRHVE